MSLDTILKIGKVLRSSSKDSMKHYKYVASPKDKNGNFPICITIPVNNDFSFRLSELMIVPENERSNLYYLRYKTSDSDSSAAKYIFGDIFYKIDKSFDKNGIIKEAKETGNYLLYKSNAFLNANKTIEKYIERFVEESGFSKQKKELKSEIINFIHDGNIASDDAKQIIEGQYLLSFWQRFSENQNQIEQVLSYAPLFEESICFEDLPNRYLKYVFENKYDKIKKCISNKKSITDLDENEKQNILKYADHSVFIHFEFEGQRKQWYEQQSIFEIVTNTLNKELTAKQNGESLVPISFIYRTLCSGNNKNDIQFPDFDFDNSFKSFAFKNDDQFKDFLYTNAVINKPQMWIKGTNINIYVFPASSDLQKIKAENYESFFFDNKSESSLFSFDFLNLDSSNDFTHFDFVFSDSGGNTTKDLIEISGIGRSKLVEIKQRIASIESIISEEKEKELNWSNVHMRLEDSFKNIFGKISIKNDYVVFDNTSSNYQVHMLKVLPLIYSDNYYQDENALNNLIDKVEFSIRYGIKGGNYSLLKYDFKLILSVQNNINNKYMEITESKSYQLGVKIGKLSKQLKKEINSFEKTYVGLLTRRVSTKDDCISFVNDICGKLTMHNKVWSTMCAEACSNLAELPLSEYDKEKIAFGFFEGYFKYEPTDKRKDFQSRLEKLLSDYEGNEELKDEVEKLSELVNEINNNN